MKIHRTILLTASLISAFIYALPVHAVSQQDSNDCKTSTGDFCERTGSCSIQGATWYQYVTADKSEVFATQGWPGLCDMTHVALVQGNCSPPQASINVSAHLSATSFAQIPEIIGPLNCAAELIATGDIAPIGATDGLINTADLNIMSQIVLGRMTADANTLARGDLYPANSGDGLITISDLLVLINKMMTN